MCTHTMCMHIYVYMYINIHTQYIYIYIYTYIHTYIHTYVSGQLGPSQGDRGAQEHPHTKKGKAAPQPNLKPPICKGGFCELPNYRVHLAGRENCPDVFDTYLY